MSHSEKPSLGDCASAPISAANRATADTDNTSIERTNNTRRAYTEIRRRILDGEMQAGEQYLEQELAALLDMSRTPVREAMIRLAEERLVEVRPRHGIRILPVTADDIREIYELLAEIQVFAVRRIAERGLSNNDYAAMTEAVAAMETAQKDGDVKRWAVAERGFHDRLLSAAGNNKALTLCRMLVDQSQQARMQALSKNLAWSEITSGHAEVIDAMRRQNPEEAQRLKRRQLTQTANRIFALLRERETAP